MYRVILRPDTEWADTPTLHEQYATVHAARAAVAADPIMQPDEYGAEPHPHVAPVEVPGCTCYRQYVCSACTVAMLPA